MSGAVQFVLENTARGILSRRFHLIKSIECQFIETSKSFVPISEISVEMRNIETAGKVFWEFLRGSFRHSLYSVFWMISS